jgi:cytosine/adenosine deaminase-related metal-dependent hydrolase
VTDVKAFALQARVVYRVDRPPIENGIVTIDGGRIVSVGATTQADGCTDLGDVALLPGLVNCHTHLEFSKLRRPLGSPGMRLVDWIRLVIAERGRDVYAPAESIRQGLHESCACGVTSIGDISLVELSAYDSRRESLDVFVEVIGFSLARSNSAFTALTETLAMHETAQAGDDIQIGISPHAPYTVSPRLLERLVSAARARETAVAMHLAESAEELELLDAGTGAFRELLEERSMWDADAIPRSSRPMDYLRMLTAAPRALVIHGNYLQGDEQSYLGANRARMSLVYCPRTHAYFRHPPYPLTELLAKNVRLALGTDSRASNPDLDLLAEMRYVARNFSQVDPSEILRMGTIRGAEALRREGDVGSITPGKRANLVALPLNHPTCGSMNENLETLLHEDSSPVAVWVRGERLAAG